ncbi:MAG: single-stranded-DNA-specific exonuclease RecJ [Omnitrophica WOR_2 bacterium RIFCSPLOWO2_01_FULL_41_12]|nr:MAG: single-stranded-DNA-specific exonuclease RecJ [Omnitrophica WOR_2 bacterium RIFCSPLOWO2_01_FULL_41_12]
MYQGLKKCNVASPNPRLQNILAQGLGISKVLAQVLCNRGIKHKEEAEKFLDTRLDCLLGPYLFSDMRKSVDIIKKAAGNKERVMIFGDYDVDGITSIALLKATLSKMGIDAMHYLPHRIKEGYGLNKNVLPLMKEKKIKVLITVDCGTNSHAEVEELRRRNIEVIITDHHEQINGSKSPASSIINPKLKNSDYQYKDLSGVGVAYKLCQALTGKNLFEDLDLVSLGTIADVVPLTGENRIIVKEGLERLSRTKRCGLKALIEISGIKDKKITSHFVSYILGPRINASGRMDSAQVSLDLLMSEKEDEARKLAMALDAHNRQRQKIENKILEEAQDIIDKEINFKEHKVIVIAKEDWHQGVLGIIASKLADRFYRPVIVISKTADFCKGSGRSIKNFHLFGALLECKEFLKTFGGHSHAVGLLINKDNIEDFKDNINRLALEKLSFEDLMPSLDIDMELTLSDIKKEIITEFEALEPFGTGNPQPLFITRNLKLKGQPQVLGRNTLKFWVTDGNVTHQAIGFGLSGLRDSLINVGYFDLVYSLELDNWQEEENVLLEVKEIIFR